MISFTFNTIFILLIFLISARMGSDLAQSAKKKGESIDCLVVKDKNGSPSIKPSYLYLTVVLIVQLLMTLPYGGLVLVVKMGFIEFVLPIFDITLDEFIFSEDGFTDAFIYGIITYWGFYAGKSLTTEFAAETLLIYTQKIITEKDLIGDWRAERIMKKALENRK